VKLREVSATYTLPSRFLGIASPTSLTVAGRELHTWTKYRGLDPEISGFEQATTPPLQRFIAAKNRVAVLAVDTQEDAEAARAFLTANDLTLPTIADQDGHVAAKLGVRELPTTLFLTSDHRVASMWEGPAGIGRLKSAAHAAARAG